MPEKICPRGWNVFNTRVTLSGRRGLVYVLLCQPLGRGAEGLWGCVLWGRGAEGPRGRGAVERSLYMITTHLDVRGFGAVCTLLWKFGALTTRRLWQF